MRRGFQDDGDDWEKSGLSSLWAFCDVPFNVMKKKKKREGKWQREMTASIIYFPAHEASLAVEKKPKRAMEHTIFQLKWSYSAFIVP